MSDIKRVRCQVHCQKGKTIDASVPVHPGVYSEAPHSACLFRGGRTLSDEVYEEDGVRIEVLQNMINGCQYGEFRLEMKNESCRENDNLRMEKPIRVYILMEERPEKITAMYLYNEWWTRPAFIEKFQEIPDYTQAAPLKRTW